MFGKSNFGLFSSVCAMAEVAQFLKALSEECLDRCTKEQLLKIADHYEVEISEKRLKDS